MRKIILSLFLLIIMLNISGCWDAKDLQDLEIPIAGAYDKDGNNITVTTISPNLSTDVPKKNRLTVLTGRTLGDTRNQRSEQVPRNLLIGMLQVGLFGEDMARDEAAMRGTLDLYLRSPQAPAYSIMAITEGPARKILSTPTENFANMGVLISDLLRVGPENTFIPHSSFFKFVRSSIVIGENPAVPVLKKQNNKVIVSGCAIFQHYKLKAILNKKETRALDLLRGDNPKGYLTYIFQKDGQMEDKGTVYIRGSRKVKVQRQGDEYYFKIKLILNGTLVEHSDNISMLEEPGHLGEIEKQLETNTENECRSLIAKMQHVYGIDCIDISRYALAKWRPELINVIEDRDFVENMKIDLEVKVQIKHTGELS